MLDAPTEDDHAELQRHPQRQMLVSWLLELPAYVNVPDDED